ncbi:MAG: DUF2784 domain-containing protein [Gammaproteobacteria bacterium]|nr:DUF2784 domain-containing protein [Gammaproteobacteria bacterium]
MFYRLLADAVLLVHLLFIIFVVLGGYLVLRRAWLIWLHLPAAIWGFALEWYRLPCPLTPLEKWALERAGESSYEGGFISHYLLAVIYPGPMPVWITTALALFVLCINIIFYGILIRRRLQSRQQ